MHPGHQALHRYRIYLLEGFTLFQSFSLSSGQLLGNNAHLHSTSVMTLFHDMSVCPAETVIMAEDTVDLDFTVISLHPGVVDTDMGNRPQEIVDSAKPEIGPEGTAKAQVELYDKLTSKDTGKFFGYKGDILPW